MIINKLTKKWVQGGRLEGNYWLSTGVFRGTPVIFIGWPQGNKRNVLTYVTKYDIRDGDPIMELFELGADPDWLNQDQFEIGLGWSGTEPVLYSDRYRLNKYPNEIMENLAKAHATLDKRLIK